MNDVILSVFWTIHHSLILKKSSESFNNQLYYIDTDEIPGFLLLLKNHIFTAPSEDTIKIVSSLRADMIFYV